MGSVFSMLSELMYTSEKLLACFTCSMLITCLVATLIMILAMGIGLGYNYCFVDIKTKHRYVPAGYRLPGHHNRYPYGYGPGYPNKYMYRVQTTEENDPDPTLPILALAEDTTLSLPATTSTTSSTVNITTTDSKTTVNSTNAVTNLTVTSDAVTLMTTTPNILNTSVNSVSTEASTSTVSLKATLVTVLKSVEDEKLELKETEQGPPPMIIPINGLDLIALLSKLRSENRNYSLQVVTT